MLGQALALIILLLVEGHQGQASLGSADHVVGLSGDSVWLRPSGIQTKVYSIRWKMQPRSSSSFFRILSWKNGSLTLNQLQDRLSFTTEDLTLLIKAAQQQDSGLYCLEVTEDSGKVRKYEFQVTVFDLVFLSVLVSTVILLMALFLGTLTCFCVRRRKRKQSQTSPEEFLTIYEDVNNVQARRIQEQHSPGEGSTIYSTIQLQSSAPTSGETANTLYSLVQSSGKPGPKKKNHNSSFSKTIYQEVGQRASKAENPARLSRRELENFCIYS
uniref:CD244 molecule n=1 Tax=Catagonus wagneri TaxID=51154 RepID=A0A8C3WK78_9CETA